MSCPSRFLTADGRVLACEGHAPAAHPKLDPHGTADHAEPEWSHLDPCAWDATCPGCEGTGGRMADTMIGPQYQTCTSCWDEGTVEDVPLRLVGPGSTFRHTHDNHTAITSGTTAMLIYPFDTDDGMWVATYFGPNNWTDFMWPDEEGWQLIRAVPPSAERPLTPGDER